MSAGEKLRFSCPKCNMAISVAAEHAGKRGKCAGCGTSMQIPTRETLQTLDEHHRLIAALRTDGDKLRGEVIELRQRRDALIAECQQAQANRDAIARQVALLEEDLEDVSFGVYRPHFTYDASDAYKAAINGIRQRQKAMIREGAAAVCSTNWTVGNSLTEGKRMTKQYQKLLLRAFNGESDASIANVSWNNFRVMQQRICKAHETLNKLGSVMTMSISDGYRDLKLEELRLVFERQEKKQQEREEQRRQRALLREEQKVQRELARARKQAEDEEADYERALETARQQIEASAGEERDALTRRIAQLETQLQEAHAKRERAIAQAQLTKSGYVYVISNIGSFGKDVYKIGLTRRLDPRERVRELGDASVPFGFDVHALIYSDNAPALESAFHEAFWARRVNRANDRKEFFRIQIEEIEQFASQQNPSVEFFRIAEAKEYRQSQADGDQGNEHVADDLTAHHKDEGAADFAHAGL